jgi:uncharacterized protein YgbK (DUF1537 family)
MDLLLSYYGDDFTGSTDAMEALTLNGVPTALFLSPPSVADIKAFRLKNSWYDSSATIKSVGIAGVSRSMHVSSMKSELQPVFEQMSTIPSQFCHYKICSTFDSSPVIGSIGYAVDLLSEAFHPPFTPLLVGAPQLNRFCIFGNLFARIDGITYRLDRHPTMSNHPVTPMTESDLRIHLSEQTDRQVDLFDLFDLESSWESQQERLDSLLDDSGKLLLFDTYNEDHLETVGKIMYEYRRQTPQLVVGSSGIEYAITSYLQKRSIIERPSQPAPAGKASRMIIMAGSAAPTTDKQIEWILNKEFEGMRIDTLRLIDGNLQSDECEKIIGEALRLLKTGKNIILYTARGPQDRMIEKTRLKMEQKGLIEEGRTDEISRMQGVILREIIARSFELGILEEKPRVVVAGGDTSGHVCRALNVHALEVLVPIAPGAPLCLSHSKERLFDGLEISLKGGQNGKTRYFESILEGQAVE